MLSNSEHFWWWILSLKKEVQLQWNGGGKLKVGTEADEYNVKIIQSVQEEELAGRVDQWHSLHSRIWVALQFASWCLVVLWGREKSCDLSRLPWVHAVHECKSSGSFHYRGITSNVQPWFVLDGVICNDGNHPFWCSCQKEDERFHISFIPFLSFALLILPLPLSLSHTHAYREIMDPNKIWANLSSVGTGKNVKADWVKNNSSVKEVLALNSI